MTPSRRTFLGAAGAAIALGPRVAAGADAPRPKVAALASTYHYLSHAYHIVGRFLDGYILHDQDGREELHRPGFDVASLFIEQTPDTTDLGRAKAAKHGVRLSPTIADALTLGTGKLAVDAVLLIAEHGDYPTNTKLQKLYPRGKYFQQVLDVFETSGHSVPVFVDKHLSFDRAEAARMVSEAARVRAPLMAGSSLPVTWRMPAVEIPVGSDVTDAVVVSRGEIEIFGFHALETLQCMVERRTLGGKPQGVVAVRCLQGEPIWREVDAGRIPRDLIDAALSRSHTRNPGDMRENVRDFVPPPGRPTFVPGPVAFEVEYASGLRATALILNGHVDDTSFAVRLGGGQVASTLMYLPAPPGANFFNPLVLRIEDFFRTGTPPYPAERTLLTGGILDAALESRLAGGGWVKTPDLAASDYRPPADSGFIRSPVARP